MKLGSALRTVGHENRLTILDLSAGRASVDSGGIRLSIKVLFLVPRGAAASSGRDGRKGQFSRPT
jgi:hypothetical protein